MRGQARSAPGNNATVCGNAALLPAATRGRRLVSVVREAAVLRGLRVPQSVVKAANDTEGVRGRRTVDPIPIRVKWGREFQYCVVFGCA